MVLVRSPGREGTALRDRRSYPQIRVRVAESIVLVVVAVFGLSILSEPIGDLAVGTAPGRALFEAAVVAAPLAVLLALWIAGPIRRQIASQQARIGEQHAELVDALERQEFHARVTRGLELADDEPATIEVLRRSLPLAVEDGTAEVLITDQAGTTLSQVASTGGEHDAGPGCSVAGPRGCPAIRHGRVLTFASGEDIDACPNLRARGAASAMCAPISIMGRPIGVVHAIGAPGEIPEGRAQANLEAMAAAAGTRIGMLRALATRERQATTDPLTGLVNRRELENRAHDLAAGDAVVAVAIVDLDRFKELNDTHGHDAGDRALRAFAHVATNRLRPNDVAARYGGEEFVLLLPGVTSTGAGHVLDRLRTDLAEEIERTSAPPFTFSAGVVDAMPPFELATLISRADDALLAAKEAGRDRIFVRTSEVDGARRHRVLAQASAEGSVPGLPADTPDDDAEVPSPPVRTPLVSVGD
jgi:diguanylate cyclase (GGDEF)-like protein